MKRHRPGPNLPLATLATVSALLIPAARSQSPAPDPVASSIEQGQTHLDESFGLRGRHRHLETHEDPDSQTHFKLDFRTFYFDREKYDDSVSKAFATGGWVGAKTPFFLDRFSFGVTGYTSQKIHGDPDEDGTVLLEPVQAGYSVLSEAFVDVRLVEGLHLFAGRKEFDTPFINPHDNWLTSNTFEAIVI